MDARQTELIKAFKNRNCNWIGNKLEHAHKLELLLLEKKENFILDMKYSA